MKETFVPVTLLSAPATKVTVSNAPPFISNEVIVKELLRFGKIASPVKAVPLGCKDAALKGRSHCTFRSIGDGSGCRPWASGAPLSNRKYVTSSVAKSAVFPRN